MNACIWMFWQFCDSFLAVAAPPRSSTNKLHNIIIISRSMNSPIDINFFQKVYDMRKSNLEAFCRRVSSVDWSVIHQHSSVKESVDFLSSKFVDVMSVILVNLVR